MDEVNICHGGTPLIVGGSGGGVILPLGGDWEAGWPRGLKIVLYLGGLLWCFMGVSIIADIFMSAIEKITSQKKKVKNRDGQDVWMTVWNPTVANLTLMALGSSSPEILLSIIELLFTEKWHSGPLGPSTIVGSAAFNLLLITAVCITAIPRGEVKFIKDVTVFAVTATFSVVAYLWLILILMGISPDVVSIWEGLVTFFLFPLEVWLAYHADIGTFHRLAHRVKPRKLVFEEGTTPEECQQMMQFIEMKYGTIPQDPNDREALMHYEFDPSSTKAACRIGACRSLAGHQNPLDLKRRFLRGMEVSKSLLAGHKTAETTNISFKASHYSVCEAEKKVVIVVDLLRSEKDKDQKVKVSYCTKDGSATSGTWLNPGDYKAKSGTLTFSKDDNCKTIEIGIMEDKCHEPTEEFYVELFNPKGAILGQFCKTKVVVLDSDGPGHLRFLKPVLTVAESDQPTKHTVNVIRTSGAVGALTCLYWTEEETAKANADFVPINGILEFGSGTMAASFQIEVMGKTKHEKTEEFRIVLEHPEKTKIFDKAMYDGAKAVMTVTLEADTDGKKKVWEQAMREINWDEVAMGRASWKEHFKEAIYVGGSKEAMRDASPKDWVLHFMCMPWQVMFAVVPPTDFCGGWLCFWFSLIMLGIITAIIGDMANLLGCALDMNASIVAVTFVALGTSLPDTFASKTAAMQDQYADNCIGNITGSNGVNVFLGLGLPWSTGAIYWAIKGRDASWDERGVEMEWPSHVLRDYPNAAFVVPAGSLGSSVGIFCVTALLAIGTLMLRRTYCGGELGGNPTIARLTALFFVILWIFYIVMSVVFEGGLSPY